MSLFIITLKYTAACKTNVYFIYKNKWTWNIWVNTCFISLLV